MSVEIISSNEWTFKNKKLERLTKDIISNGRKTTTAMYNIAKDLYEIHATKAYEDDNFKTVFDYAETVFGFKKSYVSKLINVHERFLADPESPVKLAQFTTTQMAEMLPQKDTDIVYEMVREQEITPDMTKDDIRQIVKESLENESQNSNDAVDGEFKEVSENKSVKELHLVRYDLNKGIEESVTQEEWNEHINGEDIAMYRKIRFIDGSPAYIVEYNNGDISLIVVE